MTTRNIVAAIAGALTATLILFAELIRALSEHLHTEGEL